MNIIYTSCKTFSQNFIKTFHPRTISNYGFRTKIPIRSYPFPAEVDRYSISIVDSCNGLVCLATDQHVILWNPATRESKMVPHVAAAEVEPKPYYHEIGFGFGESCGDYKVVKLIEGREDQPNKLLRRLVVSVYSLKTDSWKTLEDFEGRLMSHKGKFVDGKLYWAMIYREWKQCSGKAVAGVLCVDVKTETYEEIEPLLPHSSDAPRLRVAVLDGRLCLVSNSSDSKIISFWVLMKNKQQQQQSQSWSKMFKIFVWSGDMKLLYKLSKTELLLHSSDSLFVYNAKDKSCRYTGLSNCSSALVYVESMVSPTKYHHRAQLPS